MPSLDDLKPFLVLGLALGGVFAMSGVGLVVLYRATGVLNLAYGAIGATGALISWSLLDAGVNRVDRLLGVHRLRRRRHAALRRACSGRRSRPATRWSRRRRRSACC